jgi:hypothetical protein
MVLPDTLILGVLMVINLISLGGFALWIRIYIEQALMDIDEKLALAIQALVDKLMSGGLAEFEPPNPIQGAIAQLIQGPEDEYIRREHNTTRSRWTIHERHRFRVKL